VANFAYSRNVICGHEVSILYGVDKKTAAGKEKKYINSTLKILPVPQRRTYGPLYAY
jgi:hypothetical protein